MFGWLFKYPRALYQQGELVFAGEFGVLWWLAAAMLLGLSIFFARRLRGWSLWRRVAIHGLQLAAVAVVLGLLAQPALEVLRLVAGANTVAVLVDASESMALPSGEAEGESRFDVAARLLGEPVVAAAGDAEVVRFAFDEGLRLLGDGETPQAVGARSRLVDALTELATHYAEGALAAVVVLTDGAQNGGDGVDLTPLRAAGVPAHVVGIGPSAVAGDVELRTLMLPERVAPNTQVTARLVVSQAPRAGEAGLPRSVRARVLAGESVLAAETFEMDANATLVTQDIRFNSGAADTKPITVELVPEGEDPLPANNRRSRLLRVAAARHRVLYLEGEPRWEFKFIRRALDADEGVELVTWLRTTPRKTYRQGVADESELADGFPATAESLYEYDLIVLGSLPASELDDRQHQWLEDFVAKRGGSVLALGGRNALAEGGWDVKPLARALPVALQRRSPDVPAAYAPGEYRARPTAAGRRSPIADLGGDSPAERLAQWSSLPALADHHRLGVVKPAATVVLEGVDDNANTAPLLVAQPFGHGQCAVLATATTWRWRMRTPPEDARHVRFWRQLAHHFAAQAQPRERVAVVAREDALDVRVALKDERFRAIADAEVVARVTPPAGEPFETRLPAGDTAGVFAQSLAVAAPGVYRVDVSTRVAGQMGARDAAADGQTSRLVRVGGDNAEHFDAALNEALLARIAEATGGRVWQPDALDGLADAIAFSEAGIRERQRLPLWDAPFCFLLLVLLKCAEWSLRRYWGGI